MSDRSELHQFARHIFHDALASVNPRKAVREAVNFSGSALSVGTNQLNAANGIYVVALGKAATTMTLGLQDSLGTAIRGGVLSGPPLSQQQFEADRWQVFAGGHPLPNEASLAAGRAALDLVDRASAQQTAVVFLVSGGGSAMIEWPASDDITLADLRKANQLLTSCGASISEINSVRRGFSALKGGGLAKRASEPSLTLIVSDTNHKDEASVASGPTLLAPAEAPKPLVVVNQYQLEQLLPASILDSVRRWRSDPQVRPPTPHCVLLDNGTALEAAASSASLLGLTATILSEISEQPIDEGCRLLLDANLSNGSCLISGGEFSCPVRGDGRGGRNLETALRCAMMLDQNNPGEHCVVLSAGTDGLDGNSPAAGGIADETTIERGRASGLDAQEFLARSDSYGFFERLGDLIVTGPTGTNVRDLRLVLKSK